MIVFIHWEGEKLIKKMLRNFGIKNVHWTSEFDDIFEVYIQKS